MSDADVRKVIESKNKALERSYKSGDIQEVGKVFTSDVWQMPPNSPPLVGRDALVEFWTDAVSWGEWSFLLDTQDVAVSFPLAVERGTYRLSFAADPDAPPEMASFQDHGNYVVVWRHDQDGEWRIMWDAPVSEQPLPR